MLLFLAVTKVSAATQWVTDPSQCNQTDATNFAGQNCAPTKICGDTSGIAQCYNTASINAPAASSTSNTKYDSSRTAGGYVLNCYAAVDSAAPYCDNNGALWCNRDDTCYNTNHKDTVCTASQFGAATCGSCRSGYQDCDGNATICEAQTGVTSHGTNAVYAASCGYQCASGYIDCDGNGTGSDLNGCEVQVGASCTSGGLSGTYASTCSAGAGLCQVATQNFQTGMETKYSTTSPLLWGTQYSTGELIKFTKNGAATSTFIVDNSGQVGIGTSSPGYKLDVNGTVALGSSTSTALTFRGYINSHLISYSDGGYDLGSSVNRWGAIYGVTGTLDTLTVSATSTLATTTITDLTVNNNALIKNQLGFGTSTPLANIFYNATSTSVLNITTPSSSNILQIINDNNKDFNYFDGDNRAETNPTIFLRSNAQAYNSYTRMQVVSSSRVFVLLGSNGDFTSLSGAIITSTTDKGMGISIASGWGGSLGAGNAGGNISLSTGLARGTGDNNGGDIAFSLGRGANGGRQGVLKMSSFNADVRWKMNNAGVFRVENSGASSTAALTLNHDNISGLLSSTSGTVRMRVLNVAGYTTASTDTGNFGNANGMAVQGNYAYVAAYGANRFTVVDISSPTAPVATASISSSTVMIKPSHVAVSGNYAYVTTNDSTVSNLLVIDISSSTAPSISKVITLANVMPFGVYISGNYAYVTGHNNSLSVIDISNPLTATVVGSVTSASDLNDPTILKVVGRYAYVADFGGGGLTIVDINSPTSPTVVGVVTSTALVGAIGIDVVGNYAYVGSYSTSTFSVIDIASSTAPQQVGSITRATDSRLATANGVAVVGRYAYVSTDSNGVIVIDISKSTQPLVATTLANNSVSVVAPQDIHIVNGYAYIANFGANNFAILNIQDAAINNADIGAYRSSIGTIENRLQIGTSTYWSILQGTNNRLAINNAADSEVVSILSNGSVGVGTTSPGYALDAWGTVGLGSATSTGIIFRGYVGSNIIPLSDNVYDIGSTNYRWANIYAVTGTLSNLSVSVSTTLATTTISNITVTGNSSFSAITAGAWQGVNIAPTYGGTGQDSSAWSGFVKVTAGTWSASSIALSDVTDSSSLAFLANNQTFTGQNNFLGGNVLIGTTTTSTAGYRLFVDAGDATAAGVGVNGYVKAAGFITGSTTLDLAETYPIDPMCHNTNACPAPGDAVCLADGAIATVEKCASAYSEKVIGIISGNPGFTLGGLETGATRKVALAGRVPLKISTTNGTIKVGDKLTTSQTPGVAMKASKDGATVGVALEDYMASVTGTILTFVKIGDWTVPPAPDGSINNDPSALSGMSKLAGNIVAGLKELGIIIETGLLKVTDFIADSITTKKLCVGNTCVDENKLKELLEKNQIAPLPASTVPPLPIVTSGDQTTLSVSTSTVSTTTSAEFLTVSSTPISTTSALSDPTTTSASTASGPTIAPDTPSNLVDPSSLVTSSTAINTTSL